MGDGGDRKIKEVGTRRSTSKTCMMKETDFQKERKETYGKSVET